MFSKRFKGYALVGLILISWSALIDWRNLNNPRVQNLTLRNEGLHSVVHCDVWNPRSEEVYVKALVRLINPGDAESGRPVTASPYQVVNGRIAPRSSMRIDGRIKAYGAWPEAEVRVFVITDPAQIARLAGDSMFTKPAVQ
jgi:hypothetical protein